VTAAVLGLLCACFPLCTCMRFLFLAASLGQLLLSTSQSTPTAFWCSWNLFGYVRFLGHSDKLLRFITFFLTRRDHLWERHILLFPMRCHEHGAKATVHVGIPSLTLGCQAQACRSEFSTNVLVTYHLGAHKLFAFFRIPFSHRVFRFMRCCSLQDGFAVDACLLLRLVHSVIVGLYKCQSACAVLSCARWLDAWSLRMLP
jgi:hypothetical protein